MVVHAANTITGKIEVSWVNEDGSKKETVWVGEQGETDNSH